MSKRQTLFTAAGLILTSVLLVLSSSTTRLGFALLILIATSVWLIRTFLSSSQSDLAYLNTADSDQTESPEVFAVSQLFEATLGGMREGLLVVNKDMRVVAANRAAQRLFNPTLPKLESQRLTELTRNPAIYGAFLDALKGEERSEVKVETHGPERQVFDLRVVPLASNGSGPQGALGVFFDITRTERLEVVRQEFLSNVSHELRTPLTSILAFVETLQNGALEDKESSQRFLSIIGKNASRMHGLIDDILELTAIEGGNVQLRLAPVRLTELVNDVIASLNSKALPHQIMLVNTVPAEVSVHADGRRLERMITNLIDNGIKFGSEGGTVTVRHESKERDEIIVEDNGEGIPAQHLERLFERFYRVDRARSRDMGGTGLGLAIVKHLALLHGGEVTVASELGKGTRFTIHLPK
ncbi:MAG TPA: ATP-binding protein [Pyrinomonadaceae bacterium]|nr:ATP-binding protein [Pyrinomonadaceae bacterium]